jgi:class 3 adenylate cyclase
VTPSSGSNVESAGAPQTGDEALMVHVLFMDIVDSTARTADEQRRINSRLDAVVAGTREFQEARGRGELITIATGDGMALVFLRKLEGPMRCAVEVAQALRADAFCRLRMGVHSGPVFVGPDINDCPNVTGAGIALASRVMDCGGNGHVLVSRDTAEQLRHLSAWKPRLHYLGEYRVKRDRLHIWSYLSGDIGSGAPLKAQSWQAYQRRRLFVVIAGVVALVGAVAGLAQSLIERTVPQRVFAYFFPVEPAPPVLAPPAPPRNWQLSRPQASDLPGYTPPPPPTIVTVPPFTLGDWLDLGWVRDGNALVKQGGDFQLVPQDLSKATIEFTGRALKRKRLEWVVAYRDKDNYDLFQLDDTNFTRTPMDNGKRGKTVKVPHGAKRDSYNILSIKVTPQGIVHSILQDHQWKKLDDWQPAKGVSAGRFGFHIPGKDQISLSDFRITQN